jgi:signal transduction histidine kinase/CheY-like chemotaxis protein
VQLLRRLREPLLLVSRGGTIEAANAAAAEALGTTTSALAGTALSAHMPESGALDAGLAEAARLDAIVPLSTRDGRRFSGHPSVLDGDLFLVRLTGGPDPATRAHAFFEMIPRLERMASSGSLATLDDLTRTLLPFGLSSVGAAAGGIHLLDDSGSTLELVGSIGYRQDSVDRFRLVPMGAPLPLTDCVRHARSVFLLAREDYEAQYPDFLERFGYIQNALVCVPLVVGDRCIGAIGLGAAWPWHLSASDRDFLHAFAGQCAQAVGRMRGSDQARRESDLSQAAARLERLHAFSGALARAITPSDLAEATVDAGMAATGARSSGLWLLDDGGSTVSLVRSVGPTGPRPENFIREPIARVPSMPIFEAIQTGAPIWIESSRQFEIRYPEAFAAFGRGGEQALVCLPLLTQGRCIGAIAFQFGYSHRFLEHERAFFEMIAWYAAQALERARLYWAEQSARKAAEARQRRSAFLAESDTVLASLDHESILTIARKAVPRIADWCLVILEEELRLGLPPIAIHADPSKVPLLLAIHERGRTQGESGMETVIRTGKSRLYRGMTPERIVAANPDRELGELIVQSAVASAMIVPIAVHDRRLGAILLGSSDPRRTYDEDDLAMAEELGSKLGLALDNARLYRDAREADRLKDEFLAMLSHELRNPLVPIIAAVDLMNLDDSEHYAQEREMIQRNAEHLVRLVDDLLDVSRITRGKIELARQYAEISTLVRDALDIAFPLIEARGHKVLVTAARRELLVFADPIRITQAIANLLTNAARYTEPGGTITVTCEADGADAVVRIQDSGIGIAPDLLARVFDIYVQGPEGSPGGLGVGLTIVKRLIELHGGSVSAQSLGPTRGSEFAIRIPLSAPAVHAEPTPPQPRAIVARPREDRRVLVVDDNSDAATVIARLMTALGFVTRVANDGHAALAATAEVEPDLALIDLGMPGMDGYELARRLRESYPALRLVAVTGFGQASDHARSRAAGFDDHLVKPVTLEVLRRLVADPTS